MENKYKIQIVLIATAISIFFFTTKFRRHGKKSRKSSSSCYLKTEPKPQHYFKRVLADNSYSPFKHLILNLSNDENSSSLHPYQSKITALLKNPQLEFEFIIDGNVVLEMNDSYVWVETESKLKELAEVLSRERVFAVDTEQHSLRSFLGFTALIQISTQTEDYLVDTIALHDVMPILRPVFANTNICKVFHGADNDVLWLQRDFHIYVVNLFDTAKACEVLSKPQKSLAYLLETYCGVTTNKLLQREDWRQRPLTLEMVQYARTDAHYLLYIANCLASELKHQDSENSACLDDKFHFVREASRRSNATCLQLFSKEIEAFPGESAASSILNRHLNDKGIVSSIVCDTKFQDFVRQLCAWRDLMARMHDESLKYVLSDHAIIALAHDAPTSETDIYDSISQADLNADSVDLNSSLQSLSAVICSHIEDFTYLFNDDVGNPDDIFRLILRKHLGPNGSCPLSIYNYALLSKSNLLINRLVSKGNGLNNSKQVARKASRDLFVQKFSCKSPAYDNCRIYASDERLLCYCDRRKLDWYLRRNLAKLVDDNPPAIMLLFEPKGRPEDEDNDFYIQSKKNICVGCGEENHYLRYRVIPSCYRMHFPEHLKSHRSHDIVLLCVDCHEIAHSAAEKYKKRVAAEFGIPLFIRKVVDSSQAQDSSRSSASVVHGEDAGVSPLELRTAAMALLRHGPKMPSKRREELTQIVMKYYGGRDISDEDLERALLVGMSPHERRRVEKKRGVSLKHVTVSDALDNEPENNGSGPFSVLENTLNTNNVDGAHALGGETGSKNGSIMTTGMDLSLPNIYSKPEGCSEASVNDGKYLNSDDMEASETTSERKVTIYGCDTNSECKGPLNGTVSSKSNSKLSLLGHGPHGKQVVDHLLKEYGDDGILEFCQRWRKVFVDTIHPRYLPAGWDVTHSGRRDFGEFSVYNPTKKGSAATNIS